MAQKKSFSQKSCVCLLTKAHSAPSAAGTARGLTGRSEADNACALPKCILAVGGIHDKQLHFSKLFGLHASIWWNEPRVILMALPLQLVKRKVYAMRRHDRSLCTQKQPELKAAIRKPEVYNHIEKGRGTDGRWWL